MLYLQYQGYIATTIGVFKVNVSNAANGIFTIDRGCKFKGVTQAIFHALVHDATILHDVCFEFN